MDVHLGDKRAEDQSDEEVLEDLEFVQTLIRDYEDQLRSLEPKVRRFQSKIDTYKQRGDITTTQAGMTLREHMTYTSWELLGDEVETLRARERQCIEELHRRGIPAVHGLYE